MDCFLDRYKCPLHGSVIPRDEMGNPTYPMTKDVFQGTNTINLSKNSAQYPSKLNQDWQDPELLEEIKMATGVNLNVTKSAKGKGHGKKSKYCGLTNITDLQNTPRTRLQKKLFNRSSMKRIAERINKLESTKFQDKYCDQFNYMYNS